MNLSTSAGSGSVAAAARLAAAALRSAAADLTRGQPGLVEHAGGHQLAAQVLDGVDGLPGLLLLPRAVLVARVGERVAVVAVGVGLDEHGALALAAELRGARTASRTASTSMPLTTSACMSLSAKPAARRARHSTPMTSSSVRWVMP